MAAAANIFNCQTIINKIHNKGYQIDGVDKIPLLEKTNDENYEGAAIVIKLKQRGNSIVVSKLSFDNSNTITIDEIERIDDSSKGAGRLLLDLILCQSIAKGFNVELFASPGAFKKNTNIATQRKLLKFYEESGLNKSSNEILGFGKVKQWYYSKNHNKIKKTLRNRYTGGKQKTRKTKL